MAFTTMTGQAFFVLTALAGGPRHGYGILGEVDELSQGRVRLKIGSLYGILARLAADGLIEPDREETRDGRPSSPWSSGTAAPPRSPRCWPSHRTLST
jgi:DNA-binding PadR family transcriptional regulator